MKNFLELLDAQNINYYFKGENTDLYINDPNLKDFKVVNFLDKEYVINKLKLVRANIKRH